MKNNLKNIINDYNIKLKNKEKAKIEGIILMTGKKPTKEEKRKIHKEYYTNNKFTTDKLQRKLIGLSEFNHTVKDWCANKNKEDIPKEYENQLVDIFGLNDVDELYYDNIIDKYYIYDIKQLIKDNQDWIDIYNSDITIKDKNHPIQAFQDNINYYKSIQEKIDNNIVILNTPLILVTNQPISNKQDYKKLTDYEAYQIIKQCKKYYYINNLKSRKEFSSNIDFEQYLTENCLSCFISNINFIFACYYKDVDLSIQ